MIVRTLEKAARTNRKIISPDGAWDSTRLLQQDDSIGYGFHITHVYEGADVTFKHAKPLESVFCIEGKGELHCLEDGKKYPIAPGTFYVMDQNDTHVLKAHKDMTLACVVTPDVETA